MEALITALTTGFTNLANDCLTAIGGIVPVVLPVLAGIVVIGIGIKVVKRITGR